MGPPYRYLGTNIEKVYNQEDKVIWATHNIYYCNSEIANLEKTLTDDGKILSQYGDVRRPYPPSFDPYIDTSDELNENGVHEYQQKIGVLHR